MAKGKNLYPSSQTQIDSPTSSETTEIKRSSCVYGDSTYPDTLNVFSTPISPEMNPRSVLLFAVSKVTADPCR
ncbi:hypothetical protein NQZ68_001705 [Dissostichus eleginoides]|nr:hypothetical protein NQZ68_001705 [Dissostichus eleginoides]